MAEVKVSCKCRCHWWDEHKLDGHLRSWRCQARRCDRPDPID